MSVDPSDRRATASDALSALANARSIAVIGASATPGKIGHTALNALLSSTFAGDLVAVNQRADEVLGVPSYAAIEDVPHAVDYIILAVPPRYVPEVLASAARKGVRIAQILTSGFDGHPPDGVSVADLHRAIEGSSLRLMGPNCIGSYVPRVGIAFTPLTSDEPGNVGIASQSGGLAYDMLLTGEEEGMRYSHVLSIGNCVDLDIPDYIAHLRQDEATDAIGLYVESVGDGRRFFEELREAAKTKPVFVLKGGRTSRGAASVESHTGRLAGDYALWQTVVRQAGCSLVESTDHLLACLKAVSAPRVTGTRGSSPITKDADAGIALIGNGGGATVLACDAAEERGLKLAAVSDPTRQRLRELTAETGEIATESPVDLPLPRLIWDDGRLLCDMIECLGADPKVDGLVIHLNLLPLASRPEPEAMLTSVLARLEKADLSGVEDVYFVFRGDGSEKVDALRRIARDAVREAVGAPVFKSMEETVVGVSEARRARKRLA
ncbi:MAG: CoA-binding protein [Chloroflexota bacterium]